MATDRNELGDLANLVNIIGGVTGSKTKQKGTTTTTTQTPVSDEGVQQLINQILAGPGGVGSIGGAARRSGLYDSTTEDMLLGQLYADAAVKGEIARTPTIQTQATDMTMEQPGVGLGAVAGTLGALQAGSKIMDMFGGAAGAATAGTGAGVHMGGEFIRTGGATAAGAGGAAAGAGAKAAGFGMNMGTAIPIGGSFLTGMLGGKDAAKDPLSLGINSLAGFAALGPMGAIAAPLASLLGSQFSKKSIICTALMEQGKLDEKLYSLGQEYLSKLSPYTVYGYYTWAPAVADNIRGGGKIATAICGPLARSRTALLATKGSFLDHLKHPLGTITKFIGEPVCWAIGWVAVNVFSQSLEV